MVKTNKKKKSCLINNLTVFALCCGTVVLSFLGHIPGKIKLTTLVLTTTNTNYFFFTARSEKRHSGHIWCTLRSLTLFFLFLMFSLLEKIEQETWRETGISFVTSVTRLMERLLDYRWDL